MSVVELMQHMGRYITFSKQDILKDLGSAIPEAQGWDTGIPQADSITSPAMTDVGDVLAQCHENSVGRWHHLSIAWVPIQSQDQGQGSPPADSTTSPVTADAKDTQPSPTKTPLVDDTTVPLAKPNAETKKDLPTAWAASPAKLENQVAPTTALVD